MRVVPLVAPVMTGWFGKPDRLRCVTWGPFATPVLVPGVATAVDETSPWLSDDQLEIVYSRYGANVDLNTDMPDDNAFVDDQRVLWFDRGPPTSATTIFTATPPDDDSDPNLSRDGGTRVFGSDRPGSSLTDTFGWRRARAVADARQADAVVPVRPAPAVCHNDAEPERRVATPTELAIANPGGLSGPSVSADGAQWMFAVAGGAQTEIDAGAIVGTAIPIENPVTDLDTGDHNSDPNLSRDGTTVVFVSTRGGNRDIYTASRECLDPK